MKTITALDRQVVHAAAKRKLFGEAASVRLDRFVIEDRLGVGAMGVVYAARDPELDRAVAIKVVHAGDAAAPRVLREARALARLAHPNVLTVYEIGELGGGVYIATELIAGVSLSAWLATGDHSLREVLDHYAAAARGLAAAHAARLVHRDFKEDNVMVANDGQVKVVDFGLAVELAHEERDLEMVPDVAATGPAGTPQFMALEQHEGGALTQSTDQFAFCVSLYRALTGEYPFEEESYEALIRAKRKPPASHPRIPRRLWPLLKRGLDPDATKRNSDMGVLAAALAYDHAAERRRRGVLLAVALMTALATGGLVRMVERREAARACDGASRALGKVWSDSDRTAIRAAFSRSGRPYAGNTFSSVIARIDTYARAWREAHVEACEATRVHGHQSESLMDRRMTCLMRRRAELRELVTVLRDADGVVVDNAVAASLRLTPVAVCADPSDGMEAPPPGDREAVASLRTRLDQVKTLLVAGRERKAREVMPRVVLDAEALGYPPTHAEALLVAGKLALHAGALADADDLLLRAADIAAAAHHDGVMAEAWVERLAALGELDRGEEAMAAESAIMTMVTRSSDAGALRSRALQRLGNIRTRRGEFKAASQYLERALDLLDDGDELGRALVLVDLAAALTQLGSYDAAKERLAEALAIQEKALGNDHIQLATTLSSIAVTLRNEGKYADAVAPLERALLISDRAGGRETLLAASLHNNLGNVFDHLGNKRAAGDHLRRTLEIRKRVHGENSPRFATALANYAASLDDAEERIALYRRSRAILLGAYGADSPRVAINAANLGYEYAQAGRWEECLTSFREAAAIFGKQVGPKSANLAYTLGGVGNCLERLGRAEEAVPVLERALTIYERHHDAALRGEVQFSLARALGRMGNRDRALGLAKLAREAFSANESSHGAALKEVTSWLTSEGAPVSP